MNIIAIGFMWAFAFVAVLILTRLSSAGKDCDQRAEYWSKYEGK